MKKTLLLLLILTTGLTSIAQPKSKKSDKEKQPTQKELNEMMKEMQQGFNSMSPEEKKMMDSMGFKVPDLKNLQKTVSAIDAKDYNKAIENMNRIVPAKNATKLAAIIKTPATIAALSASLLQIHEKVLLQLKPAATAKGEEIYQAIRLQYPSSLAMGNAAAGLWMLGKAELALFVMGKVCMADPSNDNNLNNYASMLSMSGGEEWSVALLEWLNRKYPANSTILNNLGQAWFGMGEIVKANKYFDSTIRIYPMHPQANYTKSFVEENRGNRSAAVSAAKKSMQKGYSAEKENRLKKLGYDIKSEDVDWDAPMPKDALGLEKFKWPDFPMNVDDCAKLKQPWQNFKESCSLEYRKLQAQERRLTQEYEQHAQSRMKLIIRAANSGQAVNPLPQLAPKAIVKLSYLVQDKDGSKTNSIKVGNEAILTAVEKIGSAKQVLAEAEKQLEKEYEDRFGEGKENPFAAHCKDQNAIRNTFLTTANSTIEQSMLVYLDKLRKRINDELYFYQYTQWPDEFELTKYQMKMMWLSALMNMEPRFWERSSSCQYGQKPEKYDSAKLKEFDDVNCQYHSKMTLIAGTIEINCSRMTTELDLKIVKLGLKQNMDKETFGDQFMGCSVEVGMSTGVGGNVGPLKAEASINGAVRAEFDRNGISDIIIKAGANVGVGTNMIDKAADALGTKGSVAGVGISDISIEAGVKGQISLISGKSSVEGTGILDGLKK
jgi:tetratricopeptide (TPR) repeat protein